MTADFIFPECPRCGEKAPQGSGVGRFEMPRFRWTCPHCGTRTIGMFDSLGHDPGVMWLAVRPPSPLTRLRQWVAARLPWGGDSAA